jgi:hypothetical protein
VPRTRIGEKGIGVKLAAKYGLAVDAEGVV